MDDLGGRIVAHHLEFDAGIIMKELERAGMHHWQQRWSDIAKKGFCTMDADIGEWAQSCAGLDREQSETGSQVMSLNMAARLLLPKDEATKSLLGKIRTAGADAQLHRRLFLEMMKLKNEAR